jgi:uncharacterized protein YdaL
MMVSVVTHRYRGARGPNRFELQLGALSAGSYVAEVVAQNRGGSSARHKLGFTVRTLPVPPNPPLSTTYLPAPRKPPTQPALPPNFVNPTPTTGPPPQTPITPPQARTWGQSGKATTLVVYDSTSQYGWLGELIAIAAGNLATHFGKVTAEPIVDYQSGQISQYTATIYIGSTYNEPIPTIFLNDVLATTHPVVWAADNIWQLSGTAGSSANSAFQAKYGWNPTGSFFDPLDNPTTISYNGQTFTRNALNGAGTMLQPQITNASQVTVLAQANCSTTTPPTNCQSQPPGASVGPTFPWAVRSSNLTYVGEDPLAYISETDRYVAFSSLLYDALDPGAPTSHLALVRLEDVSPASDPAVLQSFADYLASQNVPFSVNLIPEYTDPFGIDNASVKACAGVPVGTACTLTLPSQPAVVAALKYIQSKGGTINQEGYTHQSSTLMNPYNGISGDDAEFYRAQCSTTNTAPYAFVNVTPGSPCPATAFVTWTGPLPGDSQAMALSRVNAGVSLFKQAGLSPPSVWITPHYFASVPDYQAIGSVFSKRYEREVFPSGLLTGNGLNYSRTISQFFPYVVHDVYGSQIIPENLGDYEATAQNGNAPRLEADLIHEAQVNLAVKQGVASFFYDANNNPLANFQTILSGIKGLGYKFVGPTDPTLPGG